MRFEANHQHIKRKIETAGFKNILKTVPKTVIEGRQKSFKKLGEIVEEKLYKNTFAMLDRTKEVCLIVESDGDGYIGKKVEVKFNETLLAFEILRETSETRIYYNDISAKDSSCRYEEKDYVVFFDYLIE